MSQHEPPLLPEQRRERILADLRRSRTMRVTDIAQTLGVTTVTVRRDLAELVDSGMIERIHGGVRLVESATDSAGRQASAEPEADTSGDSECPAVGMVVPSLDYYWPAIIRGAREEAVAAGVRVVLRGSSYEDGVDIRRQVEWLVDVVDVRGLLIAPPVDGPIAAELVGWLAGMNLPVVLVERTARVGAYHEHVESVVTDHFLGASLAVRHLAAQGHRRVGFLGSKTSPTTPAVRRGWWETAQEIGLDLDGTPDAITVEYRDPHWSGELDAMLDACLATATTALLVHSDREAIALVARSEERGLVVPGDLAVVAYDDEVAGLADPALSAVRPAKQAIGEAAVALLAKRMRSGPQRPVHRILISPHLVVRQSSTAPQAR